MASHKTTGRGWAETRHLFPLDEELRRAGFKIRWRPRKGLDLWQLAEGDLVTVEEALALVREAEEGAKA